MDDISYETNDINFVIAKKNGQPLNMRSAHVSLYKTVIFGHAYVAFCGKAKCVYDPFSH